MRHFEAPGSQCNGSQLKMSRTVEDCKNGLSYIVATRRYCSERGEENLASVIGLLISDLIVRKDPRIVLSRNF